MSAIQSSNYITVHIQQIASSVRVELPVNATVQDLKSKIEKLTSIKEEYQRFYTREAIASARNYNTTAVQIEANHSLLTEVIKNFDEYIYFIPNFR